MCDYRWSTLEITTDDKGNFLRDRAQAKRLRYSVGVLDRFFKSYLGKV